MISRSGLSRGCLALVMRSVCAYARAVSLLLFVGILPNPSQEGPYAFRVAWASCAKALEHHLVASRMRERKAALATRRMHSELATQLQRLQSTLQSRCVVRQGCVVMALCANRGVSRWRLVMIEPSRRQGGQNISFEPCSMLELAFDPTPSRASLARRFKCSCVHIIRIRCIVAAAVLLLQGYLLAHAKRAFESCVSPAIAALGVPTRVITFAVCSLRWDETTQARPGGHRPRAEHIQHSRAAPVRDSGGSGRIRRRRNT